MSSSDQLSWRVRPVVPAAKVIGAVALVVLGLTLGRHDPARWVVAGAAALALGAWAARDALAPVRLAADRSGITVLTGLVRRRHVPWAQVERVRVDRRERRGLRSELLEIDAGDSVHVLGVHDLGAPPDEVADALNALRPGA